MTNWRPLIDHLSAPDQDYVLITVGAARGSTPRDTGTKMLVSSTDVVGTIGGGQLEYVAIDNARALLSGDGSDTELMQLPLGPELAQCCGGYTELALTRIGRADQNWLDQIKQTLDAQQRGALLTYWQNGTVTRDLVSFDQISQIADEDLQQAVQDADQFGTASVIEAEKYSGIFTLVEPIEQNRFNLFLFGAGHVGRAIVHTLSPLPCTIHWVDSRNDEFPKVLPGNVQQIIAPNPSEILHKAPANSYFLIMTHSHQLDMELVAEILKKKECAYLGLIGSMTKRARFFKRLKAQGYTDTDLQRVTCPVGIAGTGGKHPTEIAISVSAEILQTYNERQRQLENGTDVQDISLRMKAH